MVDCFYSSVDLVGNTAKRPIHLIFGSIASTHRRCDPDHHLPEIPFNQPALLPDLAPLHHFRLPWKIRNFVQDQGMLKKLP